MSMKQKICVFLAALALGGCSMVGRDRLESAGPLDAGDAGEYQLIQGDGSESDLRYRLVQGEPWKFEHRLADGSWEPASCRGDCRLEQAGSEQAARYMQGRVGGGQFASCQHNNSYAVCRVAGARGARSYAYVSLSTGTPVVFELRRVDAAT
jgi:hypothetical protein